MNKYTNDYIDIGTKVNEDNSIELRVLLSQKKWAMERPQIISMSLCSKDVVVARLKYKILKCLNLVSDGNESNGNYYIHINMDNFSKFFKDNEYKVIKKEDLEKYKRTTCLFSSIKLNEKLTNELKQNGEMILNGINGLGDNSPNVETFYNTFYK